ncbi:MAG: zinc metallopeptidase, partial [Tidjanibacter sp.]|nr:zinc metallopeptidase [Tidjanibacter sp.]
VVIVGLVLINTSPAVFWVGIAMIAASALFSVVTLPVEYNASNRALEWLESRAVLSPQEMEGATISLRWAARTYLVAALSAIATLLYYIGLARNDD